MPTRNVLMRLLRSLKLPEENLRMECFKHHVNANNTLAESVQSLTGQLRCKLSSINASTESSVKDWS